MKDLLSHINLRIETLQEELKRIFEETDRKISAERRDIDERENRLQQFILSENKRINEMRGRLAELNNLRSELQLESNEGE